MTSGDQPDDQGTDDDNNVTKAYEFTSYAPDGETVYGTGVAETTGQTKTFSGTEYAEIEVKENSVEGWAGQKFYIIATATADGTTKYDLYDAEGQTVGVKVSITEQA